MLRILSAPRRFFPLCLLLSGLTCSAAAQRAPAEYRTQSVSVFGSFLYNEIGYRPDSAIGVSAGFDVTQHFLRVPLAVSLEVRANAAYGLTADHHSYTFGPSVAYGFGRYHPYVEFQVGLGNIHFSPAVAEDEGYFGDKSAIAAAGGGVDIEMFRNVAARLDFQAQHWDVDPTIHQTFIPALFSAGVNYTIPFRPFTRQGDPHYR